MKTGSGKKNMRLLLLIVSWVIFVGLCIEAGAFVCNAIGVLLLPAGKVLRLWQQADLTALYHYDPGYFFVENFFLSIVSVLKALLFYQIVKILHHKKFNPDRPFEESIGRFIHHIAYLSIGIGLFAWWGAAYTVWLSQKGIPMPDQEALRLSGADV